MTQRTAMTADRLPGARPRVGQRLALLWLVAALFVQGFVTQTHAHYNGDLRLAAVASTKIAAASADDDKNTPAAPTCPLCEEQALFGAYLASGTVAIPVPVAASYDHVATSLPSIARLTSSHAWQSRAPPLSTT